VRTSDVMSIEMPMVYFRSSSADCTGALFLAAAAAADGRASVARMTPEDTTSTETCKQLILTKVDGFKCACY
jgi:hypothetical protein